MINGIRLSRVNHCKVVSSAEDISDTAIIKIPISARFQSKEGNITDVETSKYFKVGDSVKIEMAYTSMLTEFEGYIKRINYTKPLEIECEDKMYLLRRKPITKSWKKTTLKEIINHLIEGQNIKLIGNMPVINFTNFYLKNANAAFGLQKLKDEYGLTIYFTSPGEMYVGFLDDADRGTVKYNLGDDDKLLSNVIKPILKYRNADDVRLKIKAIHVLKNNTRTEVEVGDADGELRTLYFYDLEDAGSLKQIATEEMKKYKFSGYTGSLKTFFLPVAKHGMVAKLHDSIYNERSGDYKIRKVTTTFGSGGVKRDVELGIKVS